jgi:hypothetical protein
MTLQEKRKEMTAALKRRAAAERVFQKAKSARRRAKKRLSAAVAALAECLGELAPAKQRERHDER